MDSFINLKVVHQSEIIEQYTLQTEALITTTTHFTNVSYLVCSEVKMLVL